jgi:hypothetical protein
VTKSDFLSEAIFPAVTVVLACHKIALACSDDGASMYLVLAQVVISKSHSALPTLTQQS